MGFWSTKLQKYSTYDLATGPLANESISNLSQLEECVKLFGQCMLIDRIFYICRPHIRILLQTTDQVYLALYFVREQFFQQSSV